MSRQELAEAVAAWLFENARHLFNIDGVCPVDAKYVGKLERGEHRWPSAHYREAFRAVLGAASDAQLGYFVIQGDGNDVAEADPARQDVGVRIPAAQGVGVPAARVGGTVVADCDTVAGAVFGARLKKLRAGRGLSLRRLGRLVHYSHGYLWDLETGAKRPTVEVASALDRALGSAGALSALVANANANATATANPVATNPDAVVAEGAARRVAVLPEALAGAVAVRVSVAPGAAVTVVCDEGGSGRVAVVAGGVRVLIDASGGDPAGPASSSRAVADASAAVPVGGARVYSLARRRAAG